MIDFCYFSHAATMYFHLYDYGNVKLYRTIFTFSNGPILIAIPIWRNSLVFHSWDKVQSVFIHLAGCVDMVWSMVRSWRRREKIGRRRVDVGCVQTLHERVLDLPDDVIHRLAGGISH